jgi:hypothetical protein
MRAAFGNSAACRTGQVVECASAQGKSRRVSTRIASFGRGPRHARSRAHTTPRSTERGRDSVTGGAVGNLAAVE